MNVTGVQTCALPIYKGPLDPNIGMRTKEVGTEELPDGVRGYTKEDIKSTDPNIEKRI